MCGIVGLFTYKFDNKDIDVRIKAILQRMLFSESLVFMEPRGKDSTGIALLWDDHETSIVKQPVKARQFAKEDGFWGEDHQNPEDPDANFKWLMDKWMRKHPTVQLKQALGHVRAGTKGSEYNPHNNHPIIVSGDTFGKGGPISGEMTIGVHNGGIRNDDHIEKEHKFTRVGEVDSEVIFHLIHEYNNDYTIDNLQKTFDELAGAYAVMAYNPAILNKVACMRETRPLNAAFIPELGTLVLISERKYLQHAMDEYERWRIREGESTYSYTDSEGEIQNLGKIYDTFPYLSADWYDTTVVDSVESGVFVLDLDTEVTAKTKVKDLVNVKRIFTRASNSTYNSRNSNVGKQNNSVKDSRSSSSPDSTYKPKTDDKKKDTPEVKDGIVDYTDYSDTGTGSQASTEGLAEIELEEELDAEGNTIEIPLDTISALEEPQEDDDDVCPYLWDERIEMAGDALYSSAAQLGDKLVLSKTNEDNIQELLNNYLIKTKSPDEASTILASFYDLIFPEGFALGFGEGYDTALVDIESHTGGEENLMEKEIEGLKERINRQSETIEDLQKKKNSTQKYVSIMRPLLSHLLLRTGVVDKEGNINNKQLEALKKDAGIKARPNFANVIEHRVLNKQKEK